MVPSKEFDPVAYIENSFLDQSQKSSSKGSAAVQDIEVPTIGEYLKTQNGQHPNGKAPRSKNKTRFQKRQLSAPRPRRVKATKPTTQINTDLEEIWQLLPKTVKFLEGFFDDQVTANYYRGEFKETREELIRRLLDPELSLEEVSRLLGVCPATVRRYTNRSWLGHHRTKGGQRRFRLSGVVKFVEQFGRHPVV